MQIAQNLEGEFFKQDSLVEVIKENLGQSAEVLQKSILNRVYDFVGEAPPFDDITLMVVVRDPETIVGEAPTEGSDLLNHD